MVKVTLNASCSVSKTSYDKTKGAYDALKSKAPEALVALFQACNKSGPVVGQKHISVLNKHSVVDRGGEVPDEIRRIVRVALHVEGHRCSWIHELPGHRVSK